MGTSNLTSENNQFSKAEHNKWRSKHAKYGYLLRARQLDKHKLNVDRILISGCGEEVLTAGILGAENAGRSASSGWAAIF